jgi:hypothetical protein
MRLSAGIALALLLTSVPVGAQPGDVEPSASSPPPGLSGIDEPVAASYWERGKPRWFFAATLELGFAYARPKLAAGRGRPHWEWVGLEALPLVTLEGAGAYGGLRGEVPNLDARLGIRYFAPFYRTLRPEADSHDRLDIEREDGPAGRYVAYEAELAPSVGLLGGSLFAVLTAYYVPGIQSGYHLYEESLKVVMAPPFVWRTRLGYGYGFGSKRPMRVGPAAEVIGLPGRDEQVWRAGVVAVVGVSDSFDVQATLLPVISSPDSIGLAGADWGHLGVRWRWATGQVP